MNFSTRNLNMTWIDKDLNEEENKRKRKRGKWLEERETHLKKGRERGKNKRGWIIHKKLLLLHLCHSLVPSILFFFSLCITNFPFY